MTTALDKPGIEQLVVSAVYATGGGTLDNANLVAEIERARPLSFVMAEKLAALRHWARERTVSVD